MVLNTNNSSANDVHGGNGSHFPASPEIENKSKIPNASVNVL